MCSPCTSFVWDALLRFVQSKEKDIEMGQVANVRYTTDIDEFEDTDSGFLMIGDKKKVDSDDIKEPSNRIPKKVDPSPVLSWQLTGFTPVSMTQARAVLYDSLLHIGGGFTGSALDDATVLTYQPGFELWSSLPTAPHKWFTIATFRDQLILVGGKLVGDNKIGYTNKIASWDAGVQQWTHSLPAMLSARLQPCVLSAGRYLAVAGGQRGLLDFDIELLDSETMQWQRGPQLPVKAFPSSSFVSGESWYILNHGAAGTTENVFHFHVPSLIKHSLREQLHKEKEEEEEEEEEKEEEEEEEESSHSSSSGSDGGAESVWKVLARPQGGGRTLSIAEVGGKLLALSESPSQNRMLRAHVYSPESGQWEAVGKVPPHSHTASPVCLGGGALMFVGGTTALGGYSDKLFTATLLDGYGTKAKKVSFHD